MVFGDGDGLTFTDFTKSLDVIGHRLTHGVTEHAAGLEYHIEPGALNESMSDVIGSLVKQWSLKQTVDQADWLIGAEIFTPDVQADALRSMKAPGTAYDNADFGKDPQPDHMSRFVHLPDTEDGDFGGVHINSGIPNKAFYLVATGIGGNAWQAPGHIWYRIPRRPPAQPHGSRNSRIRPMPRLGSFTGRERRTASRAECLGRGRNSDYRRAGGARSRAERRLAGRSGEAA